MVVSTIIHGMCIANVVIFSDFVRFWLQQIMTGVHVFVRCHSIMKGTEYDEISTELSGPGSGRYLI